MIIKDSYDIFISYRHDNLTLVGDLVQKLGKYYNIFWDQGLGSGYWDEQLIEALNKSKAVVINFGLNSLEKKKDKEDWFYREIEHTVKTKKPQNIIPVCYDGFTFPENLALAGVTEEEKKALETIRDKQQHIIGLWELDKIVGKIVDYMKKAGIEPKTPYVASVDEVSLELEAVAHVSSFHGREGEIKTISKAVTENDVVFLSGMGGIGKTELAKKFMEEMTGSYRSVFLRFDGSLEKTLSELKIKGFDEEEFEKRKEILKKLLDENVLLVIDNFDFAADEEIDKLIYEFGWFKCKKLITTRNSFKDIEFPWKTEPIMIGNLRDEEIKALFEEKYGKIITDSQLEKVLRVTEGLTLAVPIFASFCKNSGLSVDEMCKKAQKGIKAFEGSESIRYVKDGNKKGTVPEILRALFDMSGMTEGKKKVLCNLSLLRFMKITKNVYKKFAFKYGVGNLDDFNELVATNWVKESNGADENEHYYELHPLINELVKSDLKPSPKTSPEVFEAFVKTVLEMGVKGVRSNDFLRGFFTSLDFSIEENYKYLVTQSKEPYAEMLPKEILDEISRILLLKKVFGEDDVILATSILEILDDRVPGKEELELIDEIARKCIEGQGVSRKTMRNFSNMLLLGVLDSISLSGKGAILFEKYHKKCRKFLSLREKLVLKQNLKREKMLDDAIDDGNLYSDAYNAISFDVKKAKNGEESLESLIERYKSKNDGMISTWLIRSIIEGFVDKSLSEEEFKHILELCVEGRVEGKIEISEALKQSQRKLVVNKFLFYYSKKGFSFLSFETICEILRKYEWKDANPFVAAAAFSGDDMKLYSALKEWLYEIPIKEKTTQDLRKERRYGTAFLIKFCREAGKYLAEPLADLLFEYVESIRKTFGTDEKYSGLIIRWYKSFMWLFDDEDIRKKADERCKEYETEVMGFSLKDDE